MPEAKESLELVELWSDLLPTAIKLGLQVIEHHQNIHKWWQQLKVQTDATAKTDFAKTNIVVTGMESVGKSVLRDRWLEAIAQAGWPKPKASDDVETAVFTAGEWARIVKVIPGQNGLERSKGLDDAFVNNEALDGVIHVVDWGFNIPRSLTRQKTLWKEGTAQEGPIRTVEDLRVARMREELDEIKMVCGRIRNANLQRRRPKWLLVAATKVDLYLSGVDNAQNRYDFNRDELTEFSSEVDQLQKDLGQLKFPCEVVPISPISEDLVWPSKELQASLAKEGAPAAPEEVEVVNSQLAHTQKQNALWANFLRVVDKMATKGDRQKG